MAGLTPLEQEALETMELTRDYMAVGKASRLEYLEMMGKLTLIIKKLSNKRDGCPQGAHNQQCDCTETKYAKGYKKGESK